MQYRTLGKTGLKVSALGFGCMRLPVIDGGSGNTGSDPNRPINEREAVEMFNYAIEQGINYFDTAYMYHGGQSEKLLGKSLGKKRKKIMLTTKLPARMVERPEDFEKFLGEQLGRLNTDYLDFYLCHGLRRQSWKKIREFGILDFLDRIISEGRARHVGFSFHDDTDTFKEIVDSYDWSLAQIQYNYFDEHYQAGREGLEYAHGKGLAVVIMEPLRGGKLTDTIPDSVRKIWDSIEGENTPAQWGLRWVWNHKGVSTVLSGMSNMSQLIENVDTAGKSASIGSMTPDELDIIKRVKDRYQELLQVNCTRCGYCMPCPNGVDIPMNFTAYNDFFLFKNPERNIMLYNRLLSPEQKASNCLECGECEEKCPQGIEIINELKKVDQKLGRN
ncbi:MAG: aldo/keto reductase [Deltaproteobacteria bacterium]|nr:aldo/keto reductase [Deltaproteobacteria bacterium]